MKTHAPRSQHRKLILVAAALTASGAVPIQAADEEFSRIHKTEAYATGLYLAGNHFDGYSAGFGVGYHLTDHLSLNGELTGGSVDVDSVGGSLYTGMVNVEYNILKKPFTPFLTAGGGLFGFDVRHSYFRGSEVDAVFGVGAGLRWHVTDRFFIKADYRALEIIDPAGDSEFAHSVMVGFGFTF